MTDTNIENPKSFTEKTKLPLIPLRNTVIYPVLTVPLSVGRTHSLKSLQDALENQKLIVVAAQKLPEIDNPGRDDLYDYGVIAKVLKTIQTAEGHQSVIVQGVQRCKLFQTETTASGALWINVQGLQETPPDSVQEKALTMAVKELAYKAIELNPAIPDEAHAFIEQIGEASVLSDVIASNLQIETSKKQKLLETISVEDRLRSVAEFLNKEVSVLELSQKIKSEVKGEIDRNQREYFLREQLKAIRKELGDEEFSEAETDDLREKISSRGLPEKVLEVARKELTRLGRIPTQSPEYSVTRTYLEWLLELPWHERTEDALIIKQAQKVLDEDHFNLKDVKQRILEYLAVLKLKQTIKGPILCLVGPPGVGKTSLGKSVARALNREFVRISLGGVRDEAEIRGHRRTYIGALPGRIVQGMKKAGSINPVFVLDEIDKVGNDYRGDPSSALLEVLDPEQNDHFSDHYMEVDYDLSNVLFIATANRTDTIPPALLDRMEVIEIDGYTTQDKLKIAQQYLWPKVLKEHGLDEYDVSLSTRAIENIAAGYTREAGVRGLQRQLARICRGLARVIVEDETPKKKKKIRLTVKDVERFLGVAKYRNDFAENIAVPGVSLGMAWTPVGGDILYIEAQKMEGEGRLVLTGKLGDVMKESAQLALNYIRSHAADFGLDIAEIKKHDVHIHVPEGAIPKDGPSAGVTILTALVSLFKGVCVRSDLAMTGEITLRGNVLPVGGIKSKVIAASRAGVSEVLLPEQNKKDLEDIPMDVQKTMKIRFFGTMDEYINAALLSE